MLLPRMDFDWPAHLLALRDRVRSFVAEHVVPLEARETDDGLPGPLLHGVREKARSLGLWLPQLPEE